MRRASVPIPFHLTRAIMASPKKSSKPARQAVKSLPTKAARNTDAVKGGAIRREPGSPTNHNQTIRSRC